MMTTWTMRGHFNASWLLRSGEVDVSTHYHNQHHQDNHDRQPSRHFLSHVSSTSFLGGCATVILARKSKGKLSGFSPNAAAKLEAVRLYEALVGRRHQRVTDGRVRNEVG
jgi:hypothetical protein